MLEFVAIMAIGLILGLIGHNPVAGLFCALAVYALTPD